MNYFGDSPDRLIKILVDDICNLRCSYCYTPFEKPNILLKDNIKFIIENIIPEDTDRYEIVGGGEPTINSNFIQIKLLIEFVRRYSTKAKIICFTNGYDVSDDKINFLINNNVKIIVSCDFIGCEQRKSVNGEPSLIKTSETISRIINNGAKPLISLVANENNVDFLKDTVNHYTSLGVKNIIVDVESSYTKIDNIFTISKSYRDISFYEKIDNIVKDILKSNDSLRFVHEVGGEYRISFNDRFFLSWSTLYRIHYNDKRFDHRFLIFREMDKLNYADKNMQYKYFYNYFFKINEKVNNHILSFDVKMHDRKLRLRLDKPVIFSKDIVFTAFYFEHKFIEVKAKFERVLYDRFYDIYYGFFDILEVIVNEFDINKY
jgi:sulfatase maturation enzyme AslB (radical SAM superfamily)